MDLAYPEVEGDPTLQMRLASRYVERVLTAAESDPEVARRFLAVAGLVTSLTALFSPRVLTRALGRRGGSARVAQESASRIEEATAQLSRYDREHRVAQGGVLVEGHAAQIE
jgi:hypothetical protein